jgi:hypothetical protein
MKMKRIGAALLPACACLLPGIPASAQDKPADVYVYSTYHYCDFAKQDRADEIHAQLQQPAAEAAVKDGSITGHGWMAHQTGGKWRRVDYFTAGSVQALLDAQEKMSASEDAKAQKLNAEFGGICSSHEDYIWRRVAGNIGTVGRGNASFSTYFVCDQGREPRVDALIQSSIAPILDKMVADGKLKTWGWNEHIVGGEYRRLATISAADVKTLMEARAEFVQALDGNVAGDMLTDICPSHADYIWEIKSQAP